MACEVYGGEERPCVNPSEMRQYQRDLGQPCPRVDLIGDNVIPASVVEASWSDETRGLRRYLLLEAPAERRPVYAHRAINAMRSRIVRKALEEARAKARARASEGEA